MKVSKSYETALSEVKKQKKPAAVVESLLCNGATDVEEALLEAVRAGQTEVLEVFLRHSPQWGERVRDCALRFGQTKVLRWLDAQGGAHV